MTLFEISQSSGSSTVSMLLGLGTTKYSPITASITDHENPQSTSDLGYDLRAGATRLDATASIQGPVSCIPLHLDFRKPHSGRKSRFLINKQLLMNARGHSKSAKRQSVASTWHTAR